MVPWSEAEAFALMNSPIPSFHVQSDARGLVFPYTGGILRFQFMAAESLTAAKRYRHANITLALDPIRHDLQECCENCLSKIDPKISTEMFYNFESLLDGTAKTGDFKPLYDNGVLAHTKAGNCRYEFVKPISKLALVIMYKALQLHKKEEYISQHGIMFFKM